MDKRHLKQKQQDQSVITVESLKAMLNLSKNIANELMTLIDLLQKVADEKLLTQSPKRTK